MHIAQISFLRDPERTPKQILHDWWPLVDCAEMVARLGVRVTVVQACRETQVVEYNGVTYRFSADLSLVDMIRGMSADIFHVHGLGFPTDVLALAAAAPRTPLFLQDHASRVPRFWRRGKLRKSLSAAAGISFCASEQAKPFLAAKLIPRGTTLYEIPECSSRFTPADGQDSREDTGIHGNPAVLWVGHLDANKDPLTVLAGFRDCLGALPELQLWCCFGNAPLMAEVRQFIDEDERLSGRVHLLGKVSHERIQQLMRAADIFVLGSHREGSGCSLIEALASGLPPVVTDIPSFSMLTGHGAIGKLWKPGNPSSLADALKSVGSLPRQPLRAQVRAHFVKHLSMDSVGKQLLGAYESLIQRAEYANA
jgi:glycosyltransferase involved in cell wall biosynthesis